MRQRLTWAAFILFVAVVAVLPARAASPSSQVVKQVGEDYLSWLKEDSLFLRIKFGLPIERLPDVSIEKEQRDAQRAAQLLARLDKAAVAELDHEETLSLEILRRQLQGQVESPKFYWLAFPVTPYASAIGSVNQAFATFSIPDQPAANRYLALLRQ